jgi:hypothetical protein
LAIGCPPESPLPAHLLGCDELSESPRDAWLTDEFAIIAVDLNHSQCVASCIGNRASGRVESRVEDPAARIELAGASGRDIDDEEAARERKGGPSDCCIGRVGDDAGRLFPSPLAAGSFGVRQRVEARGEQLGRVGEQHLGAGRCLIAPQAGRPIGATAGAQEQHSRAVGGDREATGSAEGKPRGARLQPQEGVVGHRPDPAITADRPALPPRWARAIDACHVGGAL